MNIDVCSTDVVRAPIQRLYQKKLCVLRYKDGSASQVVAARLSLLKEDIYFK